MRACVCVFNKLKKIKQQSHDSWFSQELFNPLGDLNGDKYSCVTVNHKFKAMVIRDCTLYQICYIYTFHKNYTHHIFKDLRSLRVFAQLYRLKKGNPKLVPKLYLCIFMKYLCILSRMPVCI